MAAWEPLQSPARSLNSEERDHDRISAAELCLGREEGEELPEREGSSREHPEREKSSREEGNPRHTGGRDEKTRKYGKGGLTKM